MIALAASNDVTALRLTLFDEILPRHLERRFDRFRATAHQIDMRQPRWRVLDEPIAEALGGLGGEETSMSVGDPVELAVQRGNYVGMSMAEAGDRGSARGVDIVLAARIDQFDPLASDGNGQAAMDLTVKEMSHSFLVGKRWMLKAGVGDGKGRRHGLED
ncbi:hypothetical protein BQ8482_300049 [Mesorhizobium delmotii]|uniref:Uncharacterized protein n=1 Tax=Mesorhizobium delmotii TaxID=1631247 RepID=A0A2P9ANE2_9HYPH|nr:hypothetical protein BQ8482_300049 [Mesorhizobium delmotii]